MTTTVMMNSAIRFQSTFSAAAGCGSALAMACQFFDLALEVYMVKVSYQQKPYRRLLMQSYGAEVHASPTKHTHYGRQVLEQEIDNIIKNVVLSLYAKFRTSTVTFIRPHDLDENRPVVHHFLGMKAEELPRPTIDEVFAHTYAELTPEQRRQLDFLRKEVK